MVMKINSNTSKLAATTLSICLATASHSQEAPPPPDVTEIEYILCETDNLGSILLSIYPNNDQQQVDSDYITITTGGMTFATDKTDDGFFTNTNLPANSLLKFNTSQIISVFEDDVEIGSCSDVTGTVQPVTIRALEAQTGENIEALKRQIAELEQRLVQQREQLETNNMQRQEQFEAEKIRLQSRIEQQQEDLTRLDERWIAAGSTLDDVTLLLGKEHIKDLSQQISLCWEPDKLSVEARNQAVTVSARIRFNGFLSRISSNIEFIPSKEEYSPSAVNEVEDALFGCNVTLSDFLLPSDATIILTFNGKKGIVTSPFYAD